MSRFPVSLTLTNSITVAEENGTFFGKPEHIGQVAKFAVIWAYRAGGPPTYIEDMCIKGAVGNKPEYHNLVGVKMTNTNGFYFKGTLPLPNISLDPATSLIKRLMSGSRYMVHSVRGRPVAH